MSKKIVFPNKYFVAFGVFFAVSAVFIGHQAFAIPPTVTTEPENPATAISVTLNGTVNPNNIQTDARFRYSISSGLCSSLGTMTDVQTFTGNSIISYSATISVTPATTYYFCAIARNADGNVLGNVRSFITPSGSPDVITVAANPISFTSATLNGSANPNGFATTGWFRYSANSASLNCSADTGGTRVPASGGTPLGNGTSPQSYSQNTPTTLTPNTTYFFCAIASNSRGTGNGAIESFTTSTNLASVTTTPATGITLTSATLNGTLNTNGFDTRTRFIYGSTVNSSCSIARTDPSWVATLWRNFSAGYNNSVNEPISSLTTNTTYYYCIIADNAVGGGGGFSYGTIVSFTPAFTFTLSPSPASGSVVAQGDSISTTIMTTLTSSNGTTPVTFSASGMPSGVSYSFSQTSCSPTCSTILTLTANIGATLGTASIIVQAEGGNVTQLSAPPYNLTVTAPKPTISRSPQSFSIFTVEGTSPSSKTFSVTNTGILGSTLNWVAAKTQSWITSLTPLNGILSSGASTSVSASFNTSTLGVNTYNDTITISDSNASNNPQTIPITLTVSSACDPTAHNVSGFAWANTPQSCPDTNNAACTGITGDATNGTNQGLGWMSFNCKDLPVGGADYGVSIDPTSGFLSGMAWIGEESIPGAGPVGWVSFNSSNLSGCPSGTCEARLVGNQITGWAQALSINTNNSSDGWISLSGTGYGISVNLSSGKIEGWGWGDKMLAWISFSCLTGSTTGGDICGSSNYEVTTTAFDDTPSNLGTSLDTGDAGDYCQESLSPGTGVDKISFSWTSAGSNFILQVDSDGDGSYEVGEYTWSGTSPSLTVNRQTVISLAGPGYSSLSPTTYNWRASADGGTIWVSSTFTLSPHDWPLASVVGPSLVASTITSASYDGNNAVAPSVSYSGGKTYSWSWPSQFSYAGSSAASSISGTFNSDGPYQINLTVSDSHVTPHSCTATKNVLVGPVIPGWREISP